MFSRVGPAVKPPPVLADDRWDRWSTAGSAGGVVGVVLTT